MRTNATPTRKQTPVINFACPTAESRLFPLIAQFNAALAAVEKWAPIEDNLSMDFSHSRPQRPKVYGGRNGEGRIVRDGHDDVVIEAYDWFYSTRESIEKDHAIRLAEATTDDARAEVEQCFAGRLADWDRQERACKRAIPKALRDAKRNLNRAHRAWTTAELAIVNFRPANLSELAEWLAYASRCDRRDFFTPDEEGLKFMMQTAAECVANSVAN
jgi:hypothetical protein